MTDTTTSAPETPLKRVIGRKMLLLFVLGDILGAGIYALTGKVAAETGGAIWAPFLLAFTLAFLTACAYVELVGKYPQAAGAALYNHKAWKRPFFTFLVAFAVMASGITSASAAARAFGGDYLAEFVTLPTVLVAILFVLAIAAINARGISESVKVNVALTLVELTGLLVIVAIGVVALTQGDGDPSRVTTFTDDASLPLALLGGTALAFFALLGFEDSVNVAEEAREPNKDYPRALFGGLALAGLIYLAVAFTASLLVETSTLAESTGPLLLVVEAGGVNFPPEVFAAIALVAVTNTALINMIMASRLVYGMSRQGIVPAVFGKVQSTRRTPTVAIAFTTALAVLLVSTGDLADLADTTVLLLLLVFASVNIACLALRRSPVEHSHFRAPTFAPVLGAAASLLLATPLTGRDSDIYVRALILLAIGVVLCLVNRAVAGPARDVDPAEFERSSA